jgi:type I restriction enzyme R subunit
MNILTSVCKNPGLNTFRKVTVGQTFTPEQQQWLNLIKEHLIENLTIDMSDFDLLPLFTWRRGRSQATRGFAVQLQDSVAELNEAVAA